MDPWVEVTAATYGWAPRPSSDLHRTRLDDQITGLDGLEHGLLSIDDFGIEPHGPRVASRHARPGPLLRPHTRSPVITSVDHIHLHAAAPEATIQFYVSCLGGEHLGSIPSTESPSGNHGVLLGGQLLIISGFPAGMGPAEPPGPGVGALRAGFGVAHFGLQTSDLDGMVERLAAAGADLHGEPRRTGSIRYVYATVPDGVVIELVELHLSPPIARWMPLLRAVDRAIHLTRRALAKQLFA